MENFIFFEKFSEIAIIFSSGFSIVARDIYRRCLNAHPLKNIYLINHNKIICEAKCDKYESYIIIGTECPLHKFSNAKYFKINITEDEYNDIMNFDGFIIFDSIFCIDKFEDQIKMHNYKIFNSFCDKLIEKLNINNENIEKLSTNNEIVIYYLESLIKNGSNGYKLMVVSKNQNLCDYFIYKYENSTCFYNDVVKNDRIKYLMKENIRGNIIKESKMFGIFYTSKTFEDIANNLHANLNRIGRAYKVFLKDVSYERLISIENIDCIVLIDCPLFNCEINIHIPIISPFSVSCGISNTWKNNYDKNFIDNESWMKSINDQSDSKELIIGNRATELLLSKEFQGVNYKSQHSDEDMEIHIGKSGIATKYNNE